jgi:SAM-dependent methyltransferase
MTSQRDGEAPRPGPRLYRDLAEWYPLLTPVADYAEQAVFCRRVFAEHCHRPPRTLLDLGSGGGHNVAHLKATLACTLVDVAPAMLALSRRLNPQCEHVQGDMRSIRLGRVFDCVLLHDAVSYMASRADLAGAIATAFEHTAPGGVAMFQPDFVAETFEQGSETGGSDAGGRGLRYLEWRWIPEAGPSAAYGPATSHSLMVKYSRGRLPAPGSPAGLSAWYRISVVLPRILRLHVVGGFAPGNRPVQSPRQPTGRDRAGRKSAEPNGEPPEPGAEVSWARQAARPPIDSSRKAKAHGRMLARTATRTPPILVIRSTSAPSTAQPTPGDALPCRARARWRPIVYQLARGAAASRGCASSTRISGCRRSATPRSGPRTKYPVP